MAETQYVRPGIRCVWLFAWHRYQSSQHVCYWWLGPESATSMLRLVCPFISGSLRHNGLLWNVTPLRLLSMHSLSSLRSEWFSFDEILITGCTEMRHFTNLGASSDGKKSRLLLFSKDQVKHGKISILICQREINWAGYSIHCCFFIIRPVWPLLLTWFNLNPSMASRLKFRNE